MGKMHRKEKNIPIRPMAWPEAGHQAEDCRDGSWLRQDSWSAFPILRSKKQPHHFWLGSCMPIGGPVKAQEMKRKNLVCTNFSWKRECSIIAGQRRWSRCSIGTEDRCSKGNEVGVVLKQPHQRNQVEHSDLVSLEWETISGPGTCFPCFEVHGGRWCHCHRLEHEVIHRWWKTIPAYDERTGTVCSCSAPDKSNTDINASNWKLVFVSDGR